MDPVESTPGASSGIPVVDLTATTEALRQQIAWLRTEGTELIHTGVQLREHADKLEHMLGLLQGGTDG